MCLSPLLFDIHRNRIVNRDRYSNIPESDYESYGFLNVPCGHCLECRREHSRSWAVRLALELEHSSSCYFITLTYSDEFNPGFLDKGSLSRFLKRLRAYEHNHCADGIRFFACGERGDRTGRPHYHLIIFNAFFDDLVLLSKNGPLFTSVALDRLWGLGNVVVAEANFATMSYVSGYVLKKAYGRGSDEFILMSRRPGLGIIGFDAFEALKTGKVYGRFGSRSYSSLSRFFVDFLQKSVSESDFLTFKNERKLFALNFSSARRSMYELGDLEYHLYRGRLNVDDCIREPDNVQFSHE